MPFEMALVEKMQKEFLFVIYNFGIATSEITPESSNWLIELHFLQRNFDMCKREIEAQVKGTSGLCAFVLFIQGLVQRLEGNVEGSLSTFEICHDFLPHKALYFKELARSCFLLGQHQRAITVYDEIVKLIPNDWSVHHCKALCYQRLKQYASTNMQQEAFEALGKALSFNPNHRRAIFAASSIIQQHGDYDVALSKYKIAAGAISCLKRAHYLAPLNWKIAYNLGLVYLETEQYASAFNYLSAAVNLSANDASVFLALAGCINQRAARSAANLPSIRRTSDKSCKEAMRVEPSRAEPNTTDFAQQIGVAVDMANEKKQCSVRQMQNGQVKTYIAVDEDDGIKRSLNIDYCCTVPACLRIAEIVSTPDYRVLVRLQAT
ncbi:unnamed protein product [Soboliphyme baturini]|uniref:TPR_REGION domain-containing protein n=1 Tax=Soboliphyme baturini TaxID=241478 RepID=A0A183IHX8_9BILA|nr:unnamed protein product [Soboliphyme baturini]